MKNKIVGGRHKKSKTPKRKSPQEMSPLSPLTPHSYYSATINPNTYENDEKIRALARKNVQNQRRITRRGNRRATRRDQRRHDRIGPLSRGIPIENLYPTYPRERDPRGHLSIFQRIVRKIKGEEY